MVVSQRMGIAGLALIVVMFATSPASAGGLLACRNAAHFVEAATEGLRRSHHEIAATGGKLDRIANGARDRCVNALVPLLVRLLRNDENLVRFYAAEGLAYVGPPARASVPALKRALQVNKCVCAGEDCEGDPASSTLQMELALMAITGSPDNPFAATEALCRPETVSGAVAAVAPASAPAPKPPYKSLTTRAGPCGDPARTVEGLIGDLRQSRFEDAHRAGARLESYVTETPDRCVRPILPPLVEALSDRDDLIRLYAAAALGDIGPLARGAVPALEQALKLDRCVCAGSDCMKGSWSSTLAIRFAMMQIIGSEGNPKLYRCDYSGSVPMRPAGSDPS